jgi:hypothetical protein
MEDRYLNPGAGRRLKRAKATQVRDLSVELAGVRLRTPVGVGSIGGPAVRSEALTPDLYADIFLKHIAAGAGYICLPSTAHVPDTLLSDLEKRARHPASQKPTVRPLMFYKAREKASIHALPPGGSHHRRTAGVFLKQRGSGLLF